MRGSREDGFTRGSPSDGVRQVTEDEHDLLGVIYAEAQDRAEKWVAVTELPSAAMVLARTGYLTTCATAPTYGMLP